MTCFCVEMLKIVLLRLSSFSYILVQPSFLPDTAKFFRTRFYKGFVYFVAASRSGSRGTSPQTARLNIVTSPSLANAAGGVGSPLDHKGPSPNRTIGGAPKSGGAGSTRRSGIPRSLNASREQSPSSGYGTRTVSGARSCKLNINENYVFYSRKYSSVMSEQTVKMSL